MAIQQIESLAEAEASEQSGIQIELLAVLDGPLQLGNRLLVLVEPEEQIAFKEGDLFALYARVSGGLAALQAGDLVDGGYGFFAIPEVAQHLGEFEAEEVVTRVGGDHAFEQRHGLGGALLTAIDGGEQNFSVGAVIETLGGDFFECTDAAVEIAPDTCQKAEHLVGPRKAPDDVVV